MLLVLVLSYFLVVISPLLYVTFRAKARCEFHELFSLTNYSTIGELISVIQMSHELLAEL